MVNIIVENVMKFTLKMKYKNKFNEEADKRLDLGKEQYNDAWKSMSNIEILEEARQECLDLRNYALFAYIKLCKMIDVLEIK